MIDEIGIIALLVTFPLGVFHHPENTIAAAGETAGAGAGIGVDGVAIVAGFVAFGLTVATFARYITDHDLLGTG